MPSPLLLIPLAALAVLGVLAWAVWPFASWSFQHPEEESDA